MREVEITLEDMYMIMRLPIHGEHVWYDLTRGLQVLYECYKTKDDSELGIKGYEIQWEALAEKYDQLDCVLYA